MTAWYLDTSAAAKLVLDERGSAAMTAWAATADLQPVACHLLRTELLRAVRRVAPEALDQARAVLATVVLVPVTPAIFDLAATLEPPSLRTLDALHLAAALDLRDDLGGLVTYDEQLAAAAGAHGLRVAAPS